MPHPRGKRKDSGTEHKQEVTEVKGTSTTVTVVYVQGTHPGAGVQVSGTVIA